MVAESLVIWSVLIGPTGLVGGPSNKNTANFEDNKQN